MINWIQTWFKSQCDGNWEHSDGIHINTIDNPGWEVTINLEGTTIESMVSPWKIFGDFEKSWIGYKVENNRFNGACDPLNLDNLLLIFRHLVEKKAIDEIQNLVKSK